MNPIQAPTLPLMMPQTETAPRALLESGAAGGEIFGEMLASVAAAANQRLNHAEAMGEAFAAGVSDDIHGTMLALSEADIQLKLAGSVRNKVIDAFYELWRMQI
jgi:flagellar hook-basal body complex protein FliE